MPHLTWWITGSPGQGKPDPFESCWPFRTSTDLALWVVGEKRKITHLVKCQQTYHIKLWFISSYWQCYAEGKAETCLYQHWWEGDLLSCKFSKQNKKLTSFSKCRICDSSFGVIFLMLRPQADKIRYSLQLAQHLSPKKQEPGKWDSVTVGSFVWPELILSKTWTLPGLGSFVRKTASRIRPTCIPFGILFLTVAWRENFLGSP